MYLELVSALILLVSRLVLCLAEPSSITRRATGDVVSYDEDIGTPTMTQICNEGNRPTYDIASAECRLNEDYFAGKLYHN